MRTTFQPGEIVDITITGARVAITRDNALTVEPLGKDGPCFTFAVDDDRFTVQRIAPAEWPPRPGDLWRDRHGDLWFFRHADPGMLMTGYTAGARWTDGIDGLLTDGNAPWTLVHREPQDGAA